MLKSLRAPSDKRADEKELDMNRRRLHLLRICLVGGILMTMTGCTSGYVNGAARRSLASFINDVFTTAINATIGQQM